MRWGRTLPGPKTLRERTTPTLLYAIDQARRDDPAAVERFQAATDEALKLWERSGDGATASREDTLLALGVSPKAAAAFSIASLVDAWESADLDMDFDFGSEAVQVLSELPLLGMAVGIYLERQRHG